MARRKSHKRKSSKCPEPFNSLIDLAAGVTMNAIANNMEKKHRYSQRGVPNPYRASALGLASGHMKTTEDIIQLGVVMGAMGAFDDDTVSQPSQPTESWEFDDINSEGVKTNNNRYAWRLNCEDGGIYGISPENYETREEYNAALRDAKAGYTGESGESEESEGSNASCASATTEADASDTLEYIYCRVSRLDNGSNEYYLSATSALQIGSVVTVPTENGTVQAVVLSVERHTCMTAPQPPEETNYLV